MNGLVSEIRRLEMLVVKKLTNNKYGNPTVLPPRGTVKIRAKRTVFRNVWNHSRRLTHPQIVAVSACHIRIWNRSFSVYNVVTQWCHLAGINMTLNQTLVIYGSFQSFKC